MLLGVNTQVLSNPTIEGPEKVYKANIMVAEPTENQWILGFNLGADNIDNEMSFFQRNISLMEFPLDHIDQMRELILRHPSNTPFIFEPYQGVTAGLTPYSAILERVEAPDAFGQICSY